MRTGLTARPFPTGRTPGDGSAKTRSQWDLLLCSAFCLSWSSSDRISKDMIMYPWISPRKTRAYRQNTGLEPTTWDVTSSQESGSARGHHWSSRSLQRQSNSSSERYMARWWHISAAGSMRFWCGSSRLSTRFRLCFLRFWSWWFLEITCLHFWSRLVSPHGVTRHVRCAVWSNSSVRRNTFTRRRCSVQNRSASS